MDGQAWAFLIVGLSFALYLGIAWWSRVGSSSEFYVAGVGVRTRWRATRGELPTVRRWLSRRRIEAVIPARSNQPAVNVVERCIGWLKESRRVATRYEKLATHYQAMLTLAMTQRCCKGIELSSRTPASLVASPPVLIDPRPSCRIRHAHPPAEESP